jgi:hypothetical protein
MTLREAIFLAMRNSAHNITMGQLITKVIDGGYQTVSNNFGRLILSKIGELKKDNYVIQYKDEYHLTRKGEQLADELENKYNNVTPTQATVLLTLREKSLTLTEIIDSNQQQPKRGRLIQEINTRQDIQILIDRGLVQEFSWIDPTFSYSVPIRKHKLTPRGDNLANKLFLYQRLESHKDLATPQLASIAVEKDQDPLHDALLDIGAPDDIMDLFKKMPEPFMEWIEEQFAKLEKENVGKTS